MFLFEERFYRFLVAVFGKEVADDFYAKVEVNQTTVKEALRELIEGYK